MIMHQRFLIQFERLIYRNASDALKAHLQLCTIIGKFYRRNRFKNKFAIAFRRIANRFSITVQLP